jgi:phosphatidylserine/phosphatidylglycerophosphate/cardiolipin synthase-like enzyme
MGKMKSLSWYVGLTLCLWTVKSALAAESVVCRVDSRFSSQGGMGKAVIETIRESKQRITLALYGFNNADLGAELLKLSKNNVTVRLKIDAAKGTSKKVAGLIEKLRAGGVQVETVAPYGRNHNKFAVIDGKRVITGSYNWTLKAETNWENLLILDCPELATAFENEWEKIH